MKFKSNDEGKCPTCNSNMLEYFGMESEDGAIYYPWHCPDCGTDGKEWYNINFSEIRSNSNDIGTEEGICPECGAEIVYGTIEPNMNSLGYIYFCPNCDDGGIEWYDLDFDSHTIDGHEDEEIELVKEGINYKDDKLNVTTAEDNEEERAYYGKNMTKRDKVRSLDQAKRNLDRIGKDPRVTQGQAVDQLSFDDKALDTDLSRYKKNKEDAKKSAEKGDDFWADEHNKTAKQFADKIRAKHKKQEISEGLEINNLQNKPIKAIEVTLNDKSMLFRAPANVRDVFVDARLYMKPFANKLNLEVEDVKNINVNVIYEDGEKSSVRIKPFDYQDTAYERYKAFGGTEVFGQFQDWYSFNGYDEYGNKVRRRKNSKLNGYANDGSQKRLSVENKKQEDIEDDEEENDNDLLDTISLLDMALSEIPTIGVEDWGKDDELLFTADTKILFEHLKSYEHKIPRSYYDNAENDDWSNGIDKYLEDKFNVDIENGESDNTYNWNAPLTHNVEFTIIQARSKCFFKASIHRAGDVRGNYTTEFLLEFNDKDECLGALFDSCAGFCQREIKLENTTYVITPHFFNECVDIYNLDTDEAYDDVYCDCIEELREIIAENKQEESKTRKIKTEARLTDYLGILQIRDILQANPETADKEFAILDNMKIEVGTGNDVKIYKVSKNDDGEWELTIVK